jgi:hypothetical protein
VLYPDFVDQLEQRMVGVRYDKAAIRDFFQKTAPELADWSEMASEFGKWLTSEI